MKTIDERLNDPRLLEEPEVDEPIRKLYATRLMLQGNRWNVRRRL
jgi:hypothetical protein